MFNELVLHALVAERTAEINRMAASHRADDDRRARRRRFTIRRRTVTANSELALR